MKRMIGILFILAVLAGLAALFSHEVIAQSKTAGGKSEELAMIEERLDKIDSKLVTVLENQEKIFAELRRGRYFTKRS